MYTQQSSIYTRTDPSHVNASLHVHKRNQSTLKETHRMVSLGIDRFLLWKGLSTCQCISTRTQRNVSIHLYLYTTELHLYPQRHFTCQCISIRTQRNLSIQPIAFRVSFNLNLQSQSPWCLFNGTWQKRFKELEPRLRFETVKMTLQMQ